MRGDAGDYKVSADLCREELADSSNLLIAHWLRQRRGPGIYGRFRATCGMSAKERRRSCDSEAKLRALLNSVYRFLLAAVLHT